MAKRIPERIDTQWLERQEAYDEALELFEHVFPEGMPLTIANLKKFLRSAALAVWGYVLVGLV